jgi:hypothetical protein
MFSINLRILLSDKNDSEFSKHSKSHLLPKVQVFLLIGRMIIKFKNWFRFGFRADKTFIDDGMHHFKKVVISFSDLYGIR